ncbi:D-methionine transport system ATP-binding protein [Arcanobacterium wilhelmae]|uniref:D-methionine transport system ATP-binding protein n=1 Tax=Arcanobacterium wilhelmae TaxID=1803177 RepID=A0ABT9NAD4_9ACTO|nr:methionine ABC transporter ATP-binding protein [Arcanobacterium wilhelmae]MDP9800690.1 D-methionine transport system ATP-binding protein [Arcanobacterium wilhelmae]WFN90089.1 methionine ABC transporter ATP-binding protein [Arcanobacterium wilhelmae]
MITLDSVTKVYPGSPEVVALGGISLEIAAGEIHGIVGESGAGKSTLIRCLTALECPTSGRIVVDGQDLAAVSASELRNARRAIGMVFQGGHLLDSLTNAQNIAYPMKIAGVPKEERKARAAELLELVGLPDRGNVYPRQLSGGQRQRIAIARALAANPKVLLCDEPTSALDQATTYQILQLISEINERTGVTVLIITHEMEVVREICTNVTMLDRGKIVQTGRVEEVVSDVTSRLGAELVPPPRVSPDVVAPETALLDVAFSATPGQPAASAILELAAQLGADITSGRFETVGKAQVARLVLSVPGAQATQIAAALRDRGANVEERAAV